MCFHFPQVFFHVLCIHFQFPADNNHMYQPHKLRWTAHEIVRYRQHVPQWDLSLSHTGSHRLLDRAIGEYLAALRPIDNVCYNLHLRFYAAIALRLLVGYRMIGGTPGCAIINEWRGSMSISVVDNHK